MKKIASLAFAALALLALGCSERHSSPVAPSTTSSSSELSSVAASSAAGSSSLTTGSSSSAEAQALNHSPIRLVQFQGAPTLARKAVLARTATDDSLSIGLGAIKATRTFQFLLMNNSKDMLTDITLTSDNPAYEVYPGTISVIGAPDSSVSSLPIISVTAVHGLASSGTGYKVPVMRDSNATAHVTIAGTYQGAPFSVTYTMSVSPRYVSWDKWHWAAALSPRNCDSIGCDTTLTPISGIQDVGQFAGAAVYCGTISEVSQGCSITSGTHAYATGDTVRYSAVQSDCVFDETQTFRAHDYINPSMLACDLPADSVKLEPSRVFPLDSL